MIEAIFKALFSHASFGRPGGFMVEGPVIFVIPCLIAILVGVVVSFVWVCQDARKRGKNRVLTLAFILLAGWPVSILWWLWLRPPIKTEK